MLKTIIKWMFGDKQKRDMRRIMPVVEETNKVFAGLEKLTDQELRNKTHELRRLLGASPRVSVHQGLAVNHTAAEGFLSKHPDVARSIFIGTRRDQHTAPLLAFVQLREGAKASKDMADQVRMGMGRMAEHCKPDSVVFLDRIPTVEEGDAVDYNLLALAAEDCEFEAWEDLTWAEVKSMIKVPETLATVKDVMPEAYAVLKETCRRHVGKAWMAGGSEIQWQMVPFDVQIAGGIALAEGNISEMATGEGKTLVAIFPLYLYALEARGAHLVTVNDYLSKRDSEWMTPIFEFLGMTVGCIDKTDSHTPERRAQYWCDVTYGTNNEFGFDYLRDNMCVDQDQLVQRGHHFAVIDEADSVLIDEARTPLIIAGPVERSTDQYERLLPAIRDLVSKQQMLVNKLMKEAQDLLEQDPQDYEAGIRLLQAYKGSPKHNRYMKMREEPRNTRLQERVELDFLRDKKMRELEAELYFVVEEKHHSVDLTEKGREALSPSNPEYFVLSDIVDEFARIEQMTDLEPARKEAMKMAARAAHDTKAEELHSISQLLFAFVLKRRDVDYVVEDNKVIIVDEFTGRKMPGRRWSDGLHQAVEAKEGVRIESENQTLATITIQNYFRMYKSAAGMTGTAETEATEFAHTYKMDVVVVPANRPTRRQDLDDVIFKTKREKYAAVLEEIERLNTMGLPVLVGTTSVAVSETISRMLRSKKLSHSVLNAKNHAAEAEIIAAAGQKGSITIATNMAGRGTDIKLGPGAGEEVPDPEGGKWPGGLQIIGTERHESRRIDRQLRGRSGRQGDAGTSRFFLSLEDDLMLWFGGERLSGWMTKLGMEEGEPIMHPMVTRAVERAQKKVEGLNQERRKRTLDYDNVMNKQREAIYSLRRSLLTSDDVRETVLEVFAQAISGQFEGNHGNPEDIQSWDLEGFFDWLIKVLMDDAVNDLRHAHFQNFDDLLKEVMGLVVEAWDIKVENIGSLMVNNMARVITLQSIDTNWQDHLLAIDDLREGIHLRSIGQRDPLIEYTKDATTMFQEMLVNINTQAFDRFFRMNMAPAPGMESRRLTRMQYTKPEAGPAVAAQPQGGPPNNGIVPGSGA